MKQCSFKKCSVALLLMLCAFVQGALADNKVTPTLTFNPSETVYTATAGQAKFVRPLLSVSDGSGSPVRSRFKLKWTVVDANGNTPAETKDDDGKRIYVDPITGTSVQTVYGVVKIGEKVGSLTVKVTATPVSKFAGQYNEASAEYKINVTAPTVNFKVYDGDVEVTTDNTDSDPINVYTYKDKTSGKIATMDRALPVMNIWHELNGVTISDTAKYNISYSFASGDIFEKIGPMFRVKSDYLKETDEPTRGTLTITATAKDGYDVNIYKPIIYTVYVQSQYLKGDKPLKTYIKFVKNGKPQNVQSHYRVYRRDGATLQLYTTPTEMPAVVITDENGNDVTDAYVISYGSYDDNGTYVPKKVYGKDVLHTYSTDPMDSYSFWSDYKNKKNTSYISVSEINSLPVYRLDGGGAAGSPDDYIVTVKAYVKKANDKNLNDLGWYSDPDGVHDYSGVYEDQPEVTGKFYNEDGSENATGTVEGMLYGTNSKNVYTGLQSNQMVIHLLKRSASIQFSPDPSSVVLANGVEMTPTNRFNVMGLLDDKTVDGLAVDSLLYMGDNANKFHYSVFIPNEDIFHKGDAEPTGNTVKIEFISGWADMKENVEQNVPEIGTDGKPTGKIITVTGTRFFSKLMYNNDDLHMKFHGTGYVPMYYNLIPYTPQNWDISQSQAYAFHIEDNEPTTLVVDPKVIYTPLGKASAAPSFKVVDQFGVDISQHFDFTLTLNYGEGYNTNGSLNATQTDENFGSFTPWGTGTARIDVTAKLKAGDTSGYGDPTNTEFYNVITKGDWNTKDKYLYEVIYDPNEFDKATGLNDNEAKTKMGKLHFIKTGTGDSGMYPGTQAFKEVPGINITFGSADESDNYDVVSESFSTTANPELKDNDNDLDGSNGKRCLIDIPNVVFSVDDTDEDVIPTMGYIRIDAITNGWLTIDGDFSNPKDATDGRYYTLRNLSTGTAQDLVIQPGVTKKGEYRFPMALLAGQSYALYCVDGMQLHGIDFDPAFISLATDHEGWHTAVSFQNGYTGNLPVLSREQSSTVTYYVRDVASKSGGTIGDKTDGVGYHAKIDTKLGYVTSMELTGDNTITVANGAEMADRVGIVASVKGLRRTEGQVEKRPHYNLFIGDMPTYIVSDGEQFDQGNRLSTTNIPTRIWMTIGGWEHTMDMQSEFPYYRENNRNGTPYEDSWALAKMDSTGRDNMTIDNFNYHSTGRQNPTDELVRSWHAGKKDVFSVPVRGTYLKFEPEESGRLFVYVLQNGMCDLAETDQKGIRSAVANQDNNKDGSYRLRRRAMYIIDETGKPVNLVDGNSEWGIGMDRYLPDATTIKGRFPGYTYPNKNYYSDGITRVAWNYDNGDHTLVFTKPDGSGDFTNYAKDKTTVENWWKGQYSSSTGQHNRLDGPLEVLELQDTSYAVPTKGYVRYTFDVKAGKTYYMFVTGSKLGFCGFGFLPVGYTQKADEWLNRANGEKSDDERSFATSVLDALPEPTSSQYANTNGFGTNGEGKDITLDAQKQASESGSYAKMDESLKKRSFVNVNLRRTFLNQRWAGICLPFTVSEHQVKEIFGENSSVITFDSVRANTHGLNPETGEVEDQSRTIHFTRHVAQIIEAGRPYFIYPNVDGVDAGAPIGDAYTDNGKSGYQLTFKHVSFEDKPAMDVVAYNDSVIKHNQNVADESQKVEIFTYQAIGIYDGGPVPFYSYYMKLAKDADQNYLSRFVPAGPGAKEPLLNGYNTYLYPYSEDAEGTKLAETSSNAKMASFWITGAEVENNTTTGIDDLNGLVSELNVDQTNFVKGVYTVDGRKVRNDNSLRGLASGVYIMGGKKYTVK